MFLPPPRHCKEGVSVVVTEHHRCIVLVVRFVPYQLVQERNLNFAFCVQSLYSINATTLVETARRVENNRTMPEPTAECCKILLAHKPNFR
jgi:hypothetical protein